MLPGFDYCREGTPDILVAGLSVDYTACVQWSWYGNVFKGSAWGLGVLGSIGRKLGVSRFRGRLLCTREKTPRSGIQKGARNILELSWYETIQTTGP